MPGVVKNGVFAAFRHHLNKGVARGFIGVDRNARDADALVLKKDLEERAVLTDDAGVARSQPGAGKRHALIEALAADMNRAPVGGKRFSAPQEVRDLVDVVDVEGTDIENAGHSSHQ